MNYLVVACTGCGAPRVVEADKNSAQCPRCGSTTLIESANVFARTETLEEAQNAVGQVNAQRAGGELVDAAKREIPEPEDEEVTHRDDIDRAIHRAREVSSRSSRVRLAAEGLTEQLDAFSAEEWVEAMTRLDVPEGSAIELLERLVNESVVTEPAHGVYRYVD